MSSEASVSQLEIEVKVKLADRAAFAAKLPALGFRVLTPKTLERNILFDTADGSLRARGELLRIRKYGEVWKLTHKADTEGQMMAPHKVRVETESNIGDGDALTAIFERLGYRQTFVYEKYREEWTDGEGHLVLDATPIGDFAELEGEHAWIDRIAARLGVSPSAYLTSSYSTLFFDWKNLTNHPASNMTFEEAGSPEGRCIEL